MDFDKKRGDIDSYRGEIGFSGHIEFKLGEVLSGGWCKPDIR